MQHVTIDEASARLPQLVEAALNGEEIYIAKNGSAVRLEPAESKPKRRQAGSAQGLIVYMADDFDAPLEDFKEYME
jgi:antitoxin (DNA-binding transcriptional repressor) of toxin-antitoxin stability system